MGKYRIYAIVMLVVIGGIMNLLGLGDEGEPLRGPGVVPVEAQCGATQNDWIRDAVVDPRTATTVTTQPGAAACGFVCGASAQDPQTSTVDPRCTASG